MAVLQSTELLEDPNKFSQPRNDVLSKAEACKGGGTEKEANVVRKM